MLHFYFIWDPRIHHQSPEFEWKKKMRGNSFSMSATKCIERSRREHEDLVAEFNSLMSGVEATLQATGMKIERLSQNEIFLEVKRALNPLVNDERPFLPPRESLVYESARSQMASVNIEDELDEHVKIGGLLYSFVSLKDLPDATFPGVLRELLVMDFPIIINAEVVLPDQAKAVKQYKSRLRKMTAAQKDIHGGFRLNVDAQVAEHQLIKVLQELISSSLKSCQLSLTIAVRTSQPACHRFEAEQAERILADRRQRVLHAIGRMNGARGIPETLAQKRFFFSALPGLGEVNKREKDVLTLHAADLLPVEMPWKGTPNYPLMLFETPYRQLIPFSPFDSGLGDANMLIMAKSGGGKTFLAQLKLLMMARARPLVSILERGDSYEPLVELMGGRVINVDLDGRETLNPWDLPEGEVVPSNEKTAFLKNLTRHMLGDSHGSDTSLLDNVLTDAIARVYKRCSIRYSNPIPTFNDLREELANWRDAEKMQRTIDEAHLAAIKLRSWTEGGIYARLFDQPTTMRLDSDWLFFNVEGLSSDPRLETAMSMLIATAMSGRATGKTGRPSITVLDECWFLLDSAALAPEVVQLYRTARKRNSSVWGISQTVEDFVGTEFQPRVHGPGILKNASTKIIGQQPGDVTPLINHLNLNPVAVNQVKGFGAPRKGRSGEVLLAVGEKAETTQTIRIVPTPLSYWICTTFPRERKYRAWFLKSHEEIPLLQCYQELSRKFPLGLADVSPLPDEISGEVNGTGRVGEARDRQLREHAGAYRLTQDRVEPALEMSRRGGHLWIFLATPLLAQECRIYIHDLALGLGVPVKGSGLAEGIEVFPKHDAIGAGEFGNAIRGPLGIHRSANRRFWCYGADYALEDQMAYLKQLRKVTEEELRRFIAGKNPPRPQTPPDVQRTIRPSRREGTARPEFRILEQVTTLRKVGRNYVARCPSCADCGHDRVGDNLAILIADPRFYKCWAGFTKEMIRAALGCPVRVRQSA